MTYHDLARAGFGFVCALLLGTVLSLLGDVLASPIRPKIAGCSFPIAAPASQTDPAKRADIIAYLRTLSDSPVPLAKK